MDQSNENAKSAHRLSSIVPIILFSFIGVLLRHALNLLGNVHSPLNTILWSNVLGCFLMGLIVAQKSHLQHDFSQFYVGLTTGLCGSLTTYSGVMFYSCLALFGSFNDQTYPICNYLSVLIAVLSSSFVAFLIGRDLSSSLEISQQTKRTLSRIKDHFNRWIFPLLISISIPLLILLAVLLPLGHSTYLIYSVLFAPFGSLTRYFLSVVFNGKYQMPFGTLLANVFGSLLYVGLIAIKNYVDIRSILIKQILLGLLQGYCGCLTTVSTLIAELESFERTFVRYIYLLLTIVPLQVIYIVLANRFSHLCTTTN